jgi:hypothetical protein
MLTEQPESTVIFALHQEQDGYVIPPTGPVRQFSLRSVELTTIKRMRDIGAAPLLIADSFLPPVLPFPTLVVSSPCRLTDRKLRDTLNAYWSIWHYMPVPTEEDVLALRKMAFPHVTEERTRQRMQLWGPIPRHVLVQVTTLQQEQLWKWAEAVPLEEIVRLSRGQASQHIGVGDEGDAPHRLVHERAAGQDAERGTNAADSASEAFYQRGAVAIASPMLLRYIAERIKTEGKWNVAFLIDSSVGIGPFGALRGIKFEETVLAMLEKGVKFQSRVLNDVKGTAAKSAVVDTERDEETDPPGREVERTFNSATRVEWNVAADLIPSKSSKDTLLVPKDRNKAGLDALFWDDGVHHHWPLDCTVAATHGLHAQGLADAITALGWTEELGWPQASSSNVQRPIKYFWAVPEDRYKTGWRTRQPPKEGSAASVTAKDAFNNAKQYVLCVPAMMHTETVAEACKNQGIPMPGDFVKTLGQ